MSARILLPLCAAALVLTACAKKDDDAAQSEVSVETVPDDSTAPGDQTSTPGGTAGETGATPPGAQPDTTNPPAETPPPDTTTPGN
jgi:hypothetical protein